MKRPVWALYVLIVGLALHNFVMAGLWEVGVRGVWLDVVSAWKEVVLLVALVLVVRARRGLPFKATSCDWLALAFGAFVVLYAIVPQDWLGGGATPKGVLYGVRHDLLPVAAYFLGRGLALTPTDMRRIGLVVVATACAVAAFGLVDVYAISLQWWRDSGAPGWFREQLGLDYGNGLSGLGENFVYNTGNERPLRRLVSTFLSPLASSYLFVVALLLLATVWQAARARNTWLLAWLGAVALTFAGLLWTHSRSSYLALAVGLATIALSRRALAVGAAAVAVVAAGVLFVHVYPDVAPETRFTPRELEIQRAGAAKGAATDGLSDASTESHARNLRDGAETVVRHPWGYGVGNAGVTAFRTDVELKAGESTYTEVGIETGLLGALVFLAWSVALVRRVLPRSAWVGASLVAVFALALQTDVIGVPWLAYVVWTLAGDQS